MAAPNSFLKVLPPCSAVYRLSLKVRKPHYNLLCLVCTKNLIFCNPIVHTHNLKHNTSISFILCIFVEVLVFFPLQVYFGSISIYMRYFGRGACLGAIFMQCNSVGPCVLCTRERREGISLPHRLHLLFHQGRNCLLLKQMRMTHLDLVLIAYHLKSLKSSFVF